MTLNKSLISVTASYMQYVDTHLIGLLPGLVCESVPPPQKKVYINQCWWKFWAPEAKCCKEPAPLVTNEYCDYQQRWVWAVCVWTCRMWCHPWYKSKSFSSQRWQQLWYITSMNVQHPSSSNQHFFLLSDDKCVLFFTQHKIRNCTTHLDFTQWVKWKKSVL